ncbi:sarcosine oxidase [Fusarium albosuccineum]|uniref:Sarcosine oxidase n=1 Tax=Fusarium albosuccineum TaxID=1237068 RepID=A0A8H4P6I7_9HYPO|nr:sarcosine oxidase [Fusarium albosuccineum]
MPSHDSEIIIVGGGVFGLSTALWLARGGYRNITIFDRCAFDKNHYNPSRGCDGASADINKVFRMAYAERTDYQDLAIQARDLWLSWNKTIAESSSSELPEGLNPEDKLFYICGSYFLAEGPDLRDYYAESLDTMEKTAPEFRKMQFVKGNYDDEKRLADIGPKWVEKYHIIDKINNGNTNGFIDIQGGITIADKACVYAKFLCEQAGVKFVLGDPQGKLSSLIIENDGLKKRVAGIKTADGLRHMGDLVIVAAGSWTSSIIPEAHQTVEATAGTVMFIDIPKHRQDLWERFHPDNYPVWSYRRGEGDSYYQGGGFPISKEGRLKFGFRGRKFTNFQDHPTEPDLRISTPRTKYTADRINTVPLYGLSRMKEVIAQGFPELVEFGFTDSRLCWYTDSIDNDYVIDYVPGYSDSLFICTGGSGHAFKFLPVLGKHVKNQIERVPDQFTPAWKWRVAAQGKPNNGLSEGEDGPREMSKLEMASAQDFKLKQVPLQKL